jgi:hypothetical protein
MPTGGKWLAGPGTEGGGAEGECWEEEEAIGEEELEENEVPPATYKPNHPNYKMDLDKFYPLAESMMKQIEEIETAGHNFEDRCWVPLPRYFEDEYTELRMFQENTKKVAELLSSLAPEGESKLSKEFLEDCACIDKNARKAVEAIGRLNSCTHKVYMMLKDKRMEFLEEWRRRGSPS